MRARSQPRGVHRRDGLDQLDVRGSRPSRADRSVYPLPPPLLLSDSSYDHRVPPPKTRTTIRLDGRPTAMITIADSNKKDLHIKEFKLQSNDTHNASRDSKGGARGRQRSRNFSQNADVNSSSSPAERQHRHHQQHAQRHHHQQQHEQQYQQHQQPHRIRDPSDGQDRGGGSLFNNGRRGRSQSSRSPSVGTAGRRSGSLGRSSSRSRHPPNKKEEGEQRRRSSSRTRRNVDTRLRQRSVSGGRRHSSSSRTRRNFDNRHRRRSISCPRGPIENERRGSPRGSPIGSPTRLNDRQRSKSRPRSRSHPHPRHPRRLSADDSDDLPSHRDDFLTWKSSSLDKDLAHLCGIRRRNDNSMRTSRSNDTMSSSSPSNGGGSQQHHRHQEHRHHQEMQQQHQINLVIDEHGHGQFHIKSSSSLSSSSMFSHLTFKVQIDEPSQRFVIHSSMGRLDKIRELHPGMNILRTLSRWNELQKRPRRLHIGETDDAIDSTAIIHGGVLGIANEQTTNSRGRTIKADMVTMTLMGGYAQRTWENDILFQKELERFVEDALQFHLCLSGGGVDGGNDACQVVGEVGDGGGGSGGETETAARKGGSTSLLGRVLKR